ncbi:DMT family transporter [Candidatus Woesearchaeota archaeon]|nr:DMT family transporter [Candidatus Woesearchaeota archaeon]
MKERGVILVLFTALISGFSIFINKFGVKGINPYIFTWSKNIAAVMLLFCVIIFLRKFNELKSLDRKSWGKLALIGFFGGSVPFLLFFKGLQITSAANASFIHKMMFIFVAVLAAIFLKEKISKKIIIPAGMLLAGNALLLKLAWTNINIGDVMIFTAMLFWAVEITMSKNALKNISSEIVAFGRMFFGAIFILAFLLASGNISHAAALTMPHIIWILVTSLFLFLYLFTFYNGLKFIEAHVAASILLLGSVVTTLLSVAFSNAAITIAQALGMLLLVAGVIGIVGIADFAKTVKFILPWSTKR